MLRRWLNKNGCSLRSETTGFYRRIDGLLSDGQNADWLMQMGFSCEELQDLDLRQPLLQEIAEYAGIKRGQKLSPSDVARTLEVAQKVIEDHLRDIDNQLWMLQRRRDSLMRKTATIQRMIRLLTPPRQVSPLSHLPIHPEP